MVRENKIQHYIVVIEVLLILDPLNWENKEMHGCILTHSYLYLKLHIYNYVFMHIYINLDMSSHWRL